MPLPVRAVREAVAQMNPVRSPIATFLEELSRVLPIVEGGVARRGLRALVDEDPDPGVRSGMVDTSVSQSLLMLEEEGLISLTYAADAEARIIADLEGGRRVTNIEILRQGKS